MVLKPATLTQAALALCASVACASVAAAQTPSSAVNSAPANSAPANPAPAKPAAAKSPGGPVLEALRLHDQELESLRAEQRKAAQAEQKLAVENDSLTEERRKLNQSLIDTAARIHTAEERVAAAELRMRQLESGETELRASLDSRRAVIAEVLAALQRVGRRPPPAVFAGTADAIESVRIAMSLGAVVPALRGEADRLLSELSGLAQVKKDKAVERALLADQLAELTDAQNGMARLIEERQKRQAEIELAIGTERARTLALSRQADNLKDLIGKLEHGLDAVSRAARARLGEDSKADEAEKSLAALHDPDRLAPAAAFKSAKGKLSLPANGVKIREFGAPDGVGGSEKGVSIATRAGAQVTAPSDGWVVYAAPYRSYGQLLILNVGGGYHVVLAGMERMTVDLGQFVLAGEPVAVMGNGTQVASSSAAGSSSATGASQPVLYGASQPVLYIEFRKDGTPVDSGPWWTGRTGWTATENEKGRG
jgi:septal ring factor EnvC (AmiA/AmiB activator)